MDMMRISLVKFVTFGETMNDFRLIKQKQGETQPVYKTRFLRTQKAARMWNHSLPLLADRVKSNVSNIIAPFIYVESLADESIISHIKN